MCSRVHKQIFKTKLTPSFLCEKKSCQERSHARRPTEQRILQKEDASFAAQCDSAFLGNKSGKRQAAAAAVVAAAPGKCGENLNQQVKNLPFKSFGVRQFFFFLKGFFVKKSKIAFFIEYLKWHMFVFSQHESEKALPRWGVEPSQGISVRNQEQ